MKLRKEQVLLLVVLALGAWYWQQSRADASSAIGNPKTLDYAGVGATEVVLVAPAPGAGAPRDLFRVPSESSPLPPRPLPFPDLEPMPAVLPPLVPGQEAGAYHQLRIPTPATVAVHEFASGDEQSGGDPAPEAGDPTLEPDAQELERKFDQIFLSRGPSTANYGVVLNPDKIRLSTLSTGFPDVEFEWVSTNTGKVLSRRTYRGDEILRIQLAKTLENEIELRKYELSLGSTVLDRMRFVEKLLADAKLAPWVYAEAVEQARLVIGLTEGSAEGHMWLVRVLRAQGALTAEWELYQSLPADLVESPLRYRGQGEIEATLTLWRDAEEHLRRAVELGPNDARSLAALAHFLLGRGRAAEALGHAKRGHDNRAQVTMREDRERVTAVYVAALLALGRVDEARRAFGSAGQTNGHGAGDLLRGCLDYAAGQYDQAREAFLQAAGEGVIEGRLGIGCCELALGNHDAAKVALERVERGAPELRHRAQAALALLYERTGHPDEALAAAEAAYRTHPTDPYVLYVLGRQRRLAGDFDNAIAAHQAALAQRDDLVESLAEIAHAQLAKAGSGAGERGDLLLSAARFADRAVLLDEPNAAYLPYVELQGLLHFELGDLARAREAFARGQRRRSTFCDIGLALIDYRQNRVEEARQQLDAIASNPAGTAEAVRRFARTTIDLIDDHTGKEQIRDDFGRTELGSLWGVDRGGSGRVAVDEGRLVLSGQIRAGEMRARRTLDPAGDLVGLEVTMQAGPGCQTQQVGLRLELDAGGRGNKPFALFVGLLRRDGSHDPYLFLQEGTAGNAEENLGELLRVPGFDPRGVQEIAIELAPPADAPTAFGLRVLWNGTVVHEVARLKGLQRRSRQPLQIDLVAIGSGAQSDAAFDDFRMVRRRPQ